MPRKTKPPAYRLHRPSGQAVVTLRDPATGRRRDVYLGEHGTNQSRTKYATVVADFEASGRVVDAPQRSKAGGPGPDSVAALCIQFWEEAAKPRYRRPDGSMNGEGERYRQAIRAMRRVAGKSPAKAFGPKTLKAVRQRWIDAKLARNTINHYTQRVVAIMAWAAEEELIGGSQVHALRCVKGIKRGTPGIHDGKKIKPVPEAHITAVEPYLPRQVWAIVQLQSITGARVKELIGIRPVDIDMRGKLWFVDFDVHKTAHHGRERRLTFGPQSQSVIAPFLVGRPVDKPLFSAREAYAERRVSAGKGSRRDAQPRTPRQTDRTIGDAYTTDTYRRAITRACDAAGVPRWTPKRLRKNAATRIAAEFGLEHAQKVLGHSSAVVTDAAYAQRDQSQVEAVMLKLG